MKEKFVYEKKIVYEIFFQLKLKYIKIKISTSCPSAQIKGVPSYQQTVATKYIFFFAHKSENVLSTLLFTTSIWVLECVK